MAMEANTPAKNSVQHPNSHNTLESLSRLAPPIHLN